MLALSRQARGADCSGTFGKTRIAVPNREIATAVGGRNRAAGPLQSIHPPGSRRRQSPNQLKILLIIAESPRKRFKLLRHRMSGNSGCSRFPPFSACYSSVNGGAKVGQWGGEILGQAQRLGRPRAKRALMAPIGVPLHNDNGQRCARVVRLKLSRLSGST